MRPMTAREALAIQQAGHEWRWNHAKECSQARRILDALVEWREECLACEAALYAAHRRCTSATAADERELVRVADDRLDARLTAERKISALERGEEPQS